MSSKRKELRNRDREEARDDNIPCCSDPKIVDTIEGNKVCINCGNDFGFNIVNDQQRFFCQYDVENKKNHEKRWRDAGPRTVIGAENADSRGNQLNAKKRVQYARYRKIHNSLIGSLERNKYEARPNLDRICQKMNLPNYIKEDAWRIYVESAKLKLTSGRTIIGFIAASLYASIRIHEFPRLFDEVCDLELIPKRTVYRALNLIDKLILPKLQYKYKPITANTLIYKFGTELDLEMEIQTKAAKLLKKALCSGLNPSGKDPRGLSAAALYIEAKRSSNFRDKRTQTIIAQTAKITEVTLRSRIKEILKYTKEDL